VGLFSSQGRGVPPVVLGRAVDDAAVSVTIDGIKILSRQSQIRLTQFGVRLYVKITRGEMLMLPSQSWYFELEERGIDVMDDPSSHRRREPHHRR
jgi:hypothetical protein